MTDSYHVVGAFDRLVGYACAEETPSTSTLVTHVAGVTSRQQSIKDQLVSASDTAVTVTRTGDWQWQLVTTDDIVTLL